MMKTYPLFFREKVVNALTLGMNKSAACKAFAISRSTLDDWLGFKASTGTLETPKGKKELKDLVTVFTETTTIKPKVKVNSKKAINNINNTQKPITLELVTNDDDSNLENVA